MRREELKNSILSCANAELSRNYCTLSIQAEAELKELIDSGVNRMTIDECYNGSRIAQAENNMRDFVHKLCDKHNQIRRGFPVDHTTFIQARLSICPLWPFC